MLKKQGVLQQMIITDVHINLLKEPSERLCATANIIFDGVFAINDIKIIRLNKEKYCIAFPKESKAKRLGRETIAPLNSETRNLIESKIIKTFLKQKENML